MIITSKHQATSRVRPDGTEVSYYLQPEYEVHYGLLPPGVTQPWHHHEKITESILILEGKVRFHYLEAGKLKERDLQVGDLIEMEQTVHTFSNPFSKPCVMVAFRFVPSGTETSQIIKSDKVLDHVD